MTLGTLLVALHLLGVVFGLGGALMLDAALVKRLRGAPISAGDVALAGHLSLFARLGLGLLWVSGAGLVMLSPDGAASVLSNPKVQAKLFIVTVLTLNAALVERSALPLIYRNRGLPLFTGVSPSRRAAILSIGAVSAVSWAAPFVLGLAREWNRVVPAADILAGWLTAILVGLGVALALAARPVRREIPASDVVVRKPRTINAR